MGHTTISDVDTEYRLLQERLDRNVTGAPDSAAMRRVLRLLFTPEQAHIARQLPQVIAVSALAAKLEMDEDELNAHITAMAERGLALDFERNGKRYVMATPVVIGFYEFTFMRERPEDPMDDYAEAFDALFDDEAFVRSVFTGSTQLGRSFVREESVTSEILDWERATEVVRTADLSAHEKLPFSSVFGTVVVERILDALVLALGLVAMFFLLIDQLEILQELFWIPMQQ